MHTHASSIRSNCANSSVRVKFPINIYHNSNYSAGLTTTTATAPMTGKAMPTTPPLTSNNFRGRNGLRYTSGLINRKNDSDMWCNMTHDDVTDNEYIHLNGGGGGNNYPDRYGMICHKVNTAACARPRDNRHIYQQFETSLVDNNNKCLCNYDDEHYDRL